MGNFIARLGSGYGPRLLSAADGTAASSPAQFRAAFQLLAACILGALFFKFALKETVQPARKALINT